MGIMGLNVEEKNILLPFSSGCVFPPTICKVQIKKYKTVILYPLCLTWSLILRGEYKLRVFQNRVLRRIFGPKRDEI
jgi:hypothetical protein